MMTAITEVSSSLEDESIFMSKEKLNLQAQRLSAVAKSQQEVPIKSSNDKRLNSEVEYLDGSPRQASVVKGPNLNLIEDDEILIEAPANEEEDQLKQDLSIIERDNDRLISG
jgi:hypothetical protein